MNEYEERLYSILATKGKSMVGEIRLTKEEAQVHFDYYENRGFACHISRAEGFGEGDYDYE